MNGEYDYLTDPEMGQDVASAIGEGATAIESEQIGHFPMSENPKLFNAYLKEVLADIIGDRSEALPDSLSPETVGLEL